MRLRCQLSTVVREAETGEGGVFARSTTTEATRRMVNTTNHCGTKPRLAAPRRRVAKVAGVVGLPRESLRCGGLGCLGGSITVL